MFNISAYLLAVMISFALAFNEEGIKEVKKRRV